MTFSDTAGREATGGATALLKVEATAAAPHAQRVGLVPPLPEACRSFALFRSKKTKQSKIKTNEKFQTLYHLYIKFSYLKFGMEKFTIPCLVI